MPWSKTGATHYHAQIGLSYKGLTIKILNSIEDIPKIRPWDGGAILPQNSYKPSQDL